MALSEEEERALARQGRVVALVIAGAMLFWIAAQAVGPALGITGEYAILIDLLVMAAMAWAVIVAIGLWRKRRS
ncbi:MAG: DUF5337 domain-containing protein [Shimia sp.]